MRSFSVMLAAALFFTCCGAALAGAAAGDTAAQEPAAAPSPVVAADTTSGARQDVPPRDRLVVTYFHRTFRCEMCLAFEAYSEEALRTSFPDEMASGRIVWSALNLDDEENAHYEDDYDLTELSLVIAWEHDGEVVDWRKLPDIWGLVDVKQAFMDYVTYEVGITLQATMGPAKAPADSSGGE
jgi:hypothetical protein